MKHIIGGKENVICYKAAEFEITKKEEIQVEIGYKAWTFIDGDIYNLYTSNSNGKFDKLFLKKNKGKTMTIYSFPDRDFQINFGFPKLGNVEKVFGSYLLTLLAPQKFIQALDVAKGPITEENLWERLNFIASELDGVTKEDLKDKLTEKINDLADTMGLSAKVNIENL